RGHIPMQERLDLNKTQGTSTPEEVKRMQNVRFASAVGSIMYAVRCTRPDVTFAYLRNTKDMFLVYGGNPEAKLRVDCYCDAVFKTDRDDIKSQTGYVFILNRGAVDWKSSKKRLGIVPTINEPIKMFYDNSAALLIANEPGVQRGAIHYHRRYHYVRECIKLGEINLLKVHTDDNLADPFTKALPKGKLTQHARSIGLRVSVFLLVACDRTNNPLGFQFVIKHHYRGGFVRVLIESKTKRDYSFDPSGFTWYYTYAYIQGDVTFIAKRNPLGGSIPDTLGNWKNLKELYVSVCNLNGTVPRSIYNLTLLTNLSMPDNQLTGSLPPSIGAMLPNLVSLQLSDNEFSGSLPLSISNFSKLGLIEIVETKMSGKLTVNFGKLIDIYQISLAENLYGSGEADEMKFIDSLKNCSSLQILVLSYCKFQGVVPRSIGNLSDQLSYLDLSGNMLYGNLPASIGVVALHQNKFLGLIPDTIGNLTSLIKLALSSNRLEGCIPSSLGKYRNLSQLFLLDNKLSDKIPKLKESIFQLNESIDEEFFLKMREALELSSKFNVTIFSSCGVLVPFDIDDVKTILPFPATSVEELVFIKQFDNAFWENSLLFDAVFSICHPIYVKANNELNLKVASYLLNQLMVKENEIGKVVYSEIRNPLNGRWAALTSSSLSLLDTTTLRDCSDPLKLTEFKLSWSSP
ncbi:retrotransposon protein, putative, ty1-copia subclass, partial [Tanacetum coccineum]